MKRTVGFILIVALQAALLTGMTGYRHWWLKSGKKVLLKTVPVDPRSLFRGDYVVLGYDLSRLRIDEIGFEPKRGDTIYVGLKGAENTEVYTTGTVTESPPEEGIFLKGKVKRVYTSVQRHEVDVAASDGVRRTFVLPWFNGKEGDRMLFCLRGDTTVLNHYKADYKYAKCHNAEPFTAVIEQVRSSTHSEAEVIYGIEQYFVEEGRGLTLERARNAHRLLVEIAVLGDGSAAVSALYMDNERVK